MCFWVYYRRLAGNGSTVNLMTRLSHSSRKKYSRILELQNIERVITKWLNSTYLHFHVRKSKKRVANRCWGIVRNILTQGIIYLSKWTLHKMWYILLQGIFINDSISKLMITIDSGILLKTHASRNFMLKYYI